MKHMEIEVKFPVDDTRLLRSNITAMGGRSQGRVFETNFCYDNAEKALFRKKSLLRLRGDTRTTLTFKSTPETKDSQFKVLTEMEVGVDCFDTMAAILESIGFHKDRVYEKWRETFVYQDVQLCLDTLPLGTFLEIEGPREAILTISRKLKLPWESRILANYLEMFDHLRRQLNLSFSDLTFDNFRTVAIDPAWHRTFAAGP